MKRSAWFSGVEWVSALCFCAILGLAGWLRWRYATGVGIHVDEFSTLWAVRRVLEVGIPKMPSGVLYLRGLFGTYAIAAVAAISHLDYWVGRLPSLWFGMLAIVLIYQIGRRVWNNQVGLLAALGLALLPEAIEGSGRARFYAPLLFWSLLAVWLLWLALQEESTGRHRQQRIWSLHLAFAICFGLAVLSQEAVVLLYPPILLWTFLRRGGRYFVEPPSIAAHGLILAVFFGRFWLDVVGQADQLAIIQSTTPYVQVALPDLQTWRPLLENFVTVARLPWTLGAAVALIFVLRKLFQARGQISHLHEHEQSTLYFALLFGFVLVAMLTVVGDEWRHPRYALFIQPYVLLLGAAGLCTLIDSLPIGASANWVGTVLVLCLVGWMGWPAAERETRTQLPGYAQAFAYVAQQRRAEDVVLSPQAAGCAFVLGTPCTFYAVQTGYSPYVIQKEQQWVDRWTGAPLLNTEQQLRTILKTAPRVWFVTDGDRLLHRFHEEFRQIVVEQFDVAFEANGVRALLAEGWQDHPPYTVQKVYQPVINIGGLELLSLRHSPVHSHEAFYLDLRWGQVAAFEKLRLSTSVQWVTPTQRITQADGPLGRGMIFPSEADHEPVPDVKELHLPELAAGWHRLEVVVYDSVSLEPLAPSTPIHWLYVGDPPQPPAVPRQERWRAGLLLFGHDPLPDQLSAGSTLHLRLIWVAEQPLAVNATVFVHLLDSSGMIISQSDHAPLEGFFPTINWPIAAQVEDQHTLVIPPALPPGQYHLTIGWYQPDTGQRLLLEDAHDQRTLASWTIVAGEE